MESIALIKPSTTNAEIGWVDLETASNNLALQFGLGPEHSQCFRFNDDCDPQCRNLQWAMNSTHRLHHQFLESLGDSVRFRILKAANPHRDVRSGPYAIRFANNHFLVFDDFILIVDWLKAEKERQSIALSTKTASQGSQCTISRL
jgi:hypothetical protein